GEQTQDGEHGDQCAHDPGKYREEECDYFCGSHDRAPLLSTCWVGVHVCSGPLPLPALVVSTATLRRPTDNPIVSGILDIVNRARQEVLTVESVGVLAVSGRRRPSLWSVL